MKKFLQLYWQLLIFPALYIPYSILNQKALLNWLGCGCPATDVNGTEIINHFSANDFTIIFWNAIALAVVIISIFSFKKFSKIYLKFVYILLITAGSFSMANILYFSMQWK